MSHDLFAYAALLVDEDLAGREQEHTRTLTLGPVAISKQLML